MWWETFSTGVPYPNLIMDTLMQHHSVDIQWGNHDIYWMGAAAGSRPCICNAIRISAKYGNLNLLEDGYGINLVPLARLAMSRYDKDSCTCFKLDYREDEYDVRDAMLDEKMHKAITVIPVQAGGTDESCVTRSSGWMSGFCWTRSISEKERCAWRGRNTDEGSELPDDRTGSIRMNCHRRRRTSWSGSRRRS